VSRSSLTEKANSETICLLLVRVLSAALVNYCLNPAITHVSEVYSMSNPSFVWISATLLSIVAGGMSAAQESQPPRRLRTPSAVRLASGAAANLERDQTEAIRRSSREFVEAFNKGNAKAIAALWTEDGDYIDESGRRLAGRDAIEKEYARFFKENPETKIRIVIDSLRLLSDDAAIEDGRAMLDPAPAGAPASSKYTAVHVRSDSQWLMSTVRDSRIEAPSSYEKVADLEWLIGTWTAEEHGAKTESVCRWVAGKSFVERSYTVTQPDGTASSGVQLIGFNPQGGHIQSWNFTSDGGHAVGVWSPRDTGWSAEMRGTLGDGTPTTAVNTLTKLDDNAYAWQSVNRTAGDRSLPDTDEIVLRRTSSRP
jgi:uncharacterized protein (TIGR02246 family)